MAKETDVPIHILGNSYIISKAPEQAVSPLVVCPVQVAD